ncbi:MAG: hypothetical protein Q7R62_01085 [bacterium]|nr:hypothetical protein [bacterium]
MSRQRKPKLKQQLPAQILKIFDGDVEEIEKEANAFLEANPSYRVASQSCTSHTYFAGRRDGDRVEGLSMQLSIVFEKIQPAT